MDKRELRKSLRTNFNPGPRDRLNRVMLRARQAVHLPGLIAGGKLEKPVFIIGAPRSGTSMLFAILRESSGLAHWPGEAHEVWEADHHPALRGWDSNALGTSDADPETTGRIRRSFFLVTGAKKRLIDKTPRNALRIPFIDRVFPDARYVYLLRDGRDNVNSLINAWRTPRYRTYRLPEPHHIPGTDPQWWKFTLYPGWREDISGPLEVVCAKQWKLSNDFALSALSEVPQQRWERVRYEDLVADPEEEVGRLMGFLELPYESAVRAKAAAARTKPVNVVTPPEQGKWRRENPTEIENVLPLIRPTMEALGYGD
ncbi:MAG: sulfotransferase family protein [Actinomycetota bacterium]